MKNTLKLFHSLQFKVIITVILIEILMLSVLVWNSIRLMENYLNYQFEHRMTELKPLFNASLTSAILEEDLASMQELMDQYRTDEVMYYRIYNNNNQLMLSYGNFDKNKTSSDNVNPDSYLLKMPIIAYERNIGRLEMMFDTNFIRQAITTVRKQGLVIAILEIVLSILLLSFTIYMIMRHLKGLTSAAQRMADGDLEARVIVTSQDEIAQAALSFNHMADRISENQQALEQREQQIRKLNEDLENRVSQRTEQLQHSNLQLNQSIEELRQTQEQLVQADKMAALGALVAGIAHEINTPLGIGVTSASFLDDKVHAMQKLYEEDKLTRDDLETFQNTAKQSARIILTNLKRAADLIKSFKQVAVDQTSEERRDFNVHEYLNEILNSLHPRLKKTQHEIIIDCPDNITINSYPGAFYQIITNLIINSLLHGFDNIDKGKITIKIQQQNDFLKIAYQDNGKGMDDDTVNRIFDPFFTTRRGYGGTGLGMHIVFNLVSQTFNGAIECHSTPGKGVFFDIKLNIADV